MKNAVIYKSRYGSTRKYAEWIAESLGSDLFEEAEISGSGLAGYSTIIFGGGLYASGINGISLITKNFESLKEKNLIVFTVGLASPVDTSIYKPIIEKNIPEEMRGSIKFFHLRGGIDYGELNMVHKGMMAMLKKMVGKKKEEDKTEEDRQMLETYGQRVDFSDRDSINPLVEYVLGLDGKGNQNES